MGLKRLSQAVTPVDAGNVDPNRYVYLTPENTEPSLGVPSGNGYILFSNVDGSRTFTEIGNLLIQGDGVLIDANGRISVDPNILVNVNLAANVDVTRTGFTRFEFVTPNGQVLLTGTDIYGQTLDFSANDQIMVYVDGFLLQPNIDYVYANGFNDPNVTSTLTLDTGTRTNSIVSIHRISPTLFAQGPDGNAAFVGTTDEVAEGSNNLYFTNTRARGAFSSSSSIDYDQANGIFTANIEYANGVIEAFIDDNTTTDNITEGTNLYFTNTRAILAVRDNINTSNVAEGSNLYFTNTRAVGALIAGQNITIESNGMIVADTAGTFSGNTDLVPEGVANLYFTNTRAIDAVTNANISLFINDSGYLTSADLTTSNVSEGSNLYYTNARVEAFIEDSITTANIAEGANLYFTNARAIAAINDNINTSNVAEGSNLYFTNARVEGFVNQNITTSNIAEGSNLYFTNTRAVGSLTAGDNIVIESNGLIVATATFGGALPTFYTSNIVEDGDVTTGNVYFTTARARAALNAGFGLSYDNVTGTFYFEETEVTTSNIAEGANLYFTNTRAINALTAGDNIVIEANGMIISSATISGLPTLYASNIVEDGNTTTGNVFFSNARARGAFTFGPGLNYNVLTGSLQANVRSVNGQTGIVVLDTDDVAEGTANLYFTNDRVYSSLTAGNGVSAAQLANGTVEVETAFSDVAVLDVIAAANDVISGNIIPALDATYTLGNATHAWKDVWLSAESIRLGQLQLSAPGGQLRITNPTSATLAFNTSEVAEGSNLWFTNSRVYSSLTAGLGINAANLANGTIALAFGNANILAYIDDAITTDNVSEGAVNLYFSNARTRRAFTAGPGINAANLSVGILSVDTTGGGLLSGFVNASNVIETGNTTSGNVFFNNARARAAFTAGPGINPANLALGSISANVVSVAGKTGVVVLYTGNILESGNTTTGNVFFSNTRARRAFTAGTGVDAANLANGIITVTGGAGGGSSNFTEANILAGYGIAVGRADGNATITNTGVVRVRAADAAGNSILTATDAGGNVELSLRPNVFVQDTLSANNIVANALIVNGQSLIGGSQEFIGTIAASNVIETGNPTTGNVFFSNTRARRAFTAGTGIDAINFAIGTITVDGGALKTFGGSTSNIAEGSNLYYTNARVLAYLQNSGDLDSDFIEQGSNNLYFSNTLARRAFTAGSGIDSDDLANGILTSTISEFTGNTDLVPEGVSNLYYTNDRVNTRIAAYLAENNVAFSNDQVLAYLQDSGDLTTDDVPQGTSNLYFSNTLAIRAFTAGSGIDSANLANGVLSTSFTEFTGNTDLVPEGSANLYFTNQRARNAVINLDISAFINDAGYLTAANLYTDSNARTAISTTNTGVGYGNISYDTGTGVVTYSRVTNSNIYSSLTAGTGIDAADLANGTITSTVSEFSGTTSDVPEGSNLYFTNARVLGYLNEVFASGSGPSDFLDDATFTNITVLGEIITAGDGGSITNVNLFSGNTVRANNWVGIRTGNVIESDGKFYYTDQRAYANTILIPLSAFTDDLNLPTLATIRTQFGANANTGLGYDSGNGIFYINVGANLTVNAAGYLNGAGQYTDALAQAAAKSTIGANTLPFEGHGSLRYNSGTGTISLVPISNANVRSALTASNGLSYNQVTGQFDVKMGTNFSSNATGHLNFYRYTDAEAKAAANSALRASNTFTDGHGALIYNNGQYTLQKVTNANVRSAISAGTGINYAESGGVVSVKVGDYLSVNAGGYLTATAPGNPTESRTAFGAANVGTGFGNLYYDNSSGVFTLEKVSQANIRTSISGGAGINYVTASGVITAKFGGNLFANGTGHLDAVKATIDAGALNTIYGNFAAANTGSGYGNLLYDNTTGTFTYEKVTADSIRSAVYTGTGAITAVNRNPAGETANLLGNIWFDSSTGTINHLAVTTSNVRSRFSAANIGTGYGNVFFNNTTGVISFERITPLSVRTAFTSAESTPPGQEGFGNLVYNQSTGSFSLTKVTKGDIRSSIAVVNNNGIGNLFYDNTTGNITFAAAKVGEYLSVNNLGYLNATWPNFTDIRNAIAVTNEGVGYGNLRYDSGAGEFVYTRVSNANIRGAFVFTGSSFDVDGGTGEIGLKISSNLSVNAAGYIDVTGGAGQSYTFTNPLLDTSGTVSLKVGANLTVNAGGYLEAVAGSSGVAFNDGEVFLDTGSVLNVDPQANIRMRSLGVGVEATGTAGEIIATNDITAFYSSDERLKTNVSVIDNALVKLDKIRGVSFDWNDIAQEMYPDRTVRDVGVIAQEIEQVLPEVVADRDNGYKAVRYEKLVALLIQAVKELKQEVDELKKNR